MLIKNARILLPEVEDLIFADVKISDGHIECWGRELSGDDVYDANGLVLAPGFIDLHVHMREPGAEHKGTFRTEGRAAAVGGFTHVFAMPNTSPSPDSKEHYLMIRELSKGFESCRRLLLSLSPCMEVLHVRLPAKFFQI